MKYLPLHNHDIVSSLFQRGKMGGWQLEVVKMAVYMMFPVTLFHYFNQPQYYEEYVAKVKKELYPPQSAEMDKLLREKFDKIREQRELDELKTLIEKHK